MLLEAAGLDRLLAVDLHCGQIQGFFHNVPVDNLEARVEVVPFVGEYIKNHYGDGETSLSLR
jgi:ribose-phosphate pyrophosphokinase